MHYIVIPEGIAATPDGTPCARPSFVYARVLDYAAGMCRPEDTVYLAPANVRPCGTEHGLARTYLEKKNNRLNVVCPDLVPDEYIDTFGNARYLKKYLRDDLTATEFALICAYLHAHRAAWCFRKAGYRIIRVHRVYYRVSPEPICRRWWYYRYKPIHLVYELLAVCRDMVKYRSDNGRAQK